MRYQYDQDELAILFDWARKAFNASIVLMAGFVLEIFRFIPDSSQSSHWLRRREG
jgi:hypothetical protein